MAADGIEGVVCKMHLWAEGGVFVVNDIRGGVGFGTRCSEYYG